MDLDATVIESHKRARWPTTKGGARLSAQRGGVGGATGAGRSSRDGNVPTGMDTLAVARRASRRCPRPSAPAPSGATARVTTRPCSSTWYASRSPSRFRRICRRSCGRSAPTRPSSGPMFEDRVTETVRVAEVEFTPGDWPKRRTRCGYWRLESPALARDGSTSPSRYLAVVSNRGEELTPATLVRRHWEKAGTIEFVHDVADDLAARVPPSGESGANAVEYRLTLLTYNVLTVLRRFVAEHFGTRAPSACATRCSPSLPKSARPRGARARLGVPPQTVDELGRGARALRDLRAALRTASRPAVFRAFSPRTASASGIRPGSIRRCRSPLVARPLGALDGNGRALDKACPTE